MTWEKVIWPDREEVDSYHSWAGNFWSIFKPDESCQGLRRDWIGMGLGRMGTDQIFENFGK